MRVRTRRIAISLGLIVFVVLSLFYGLLWFSALVDAMHKQDATYGRLHSLFHGLSAYREANGRWPATLHDLINAKQAGSWLDESDLLDPIYHDPWVYHPDAKAGTKEYLMAQSKPITIRVWPLLIKWNAACDAEGVGRHVTETIFDFRQNTGNELPREK